VQEVVGGRKRRWGGGVQEMGEEGERGDPFIAVVHSSWNSV
jgi:hypothetical protein